MDRISDFSSVGVDTSINNNFLSNATSSLHNSSTSSPLSLTEPLASSRKPSASLRREDTSFSAEGGMSCEQSQGIGHGKTSAYLLQLHHLFRK
jgi:hypothetical protein